MHQAAAILAATAILLTACGGGGGATQTATLLDQTVTSSGAPSGGAAGRSVWLVSVDGPQLLIDRAGTVTVCAQGQWDQTLTADTQILADIAMTAPVAQPSGGTQTLAATGAVYPIPFNRCATFDVNAATTRSTAVQFNIRVGIGPTSALGAYTATVRWTATISY